VASPHHSELVLGGARSGKSRHALAQARRAPGRVAFLATAPPLDPDMRERIDRHRAERPPEWTTIEEPLDLVSVSRRLAAGHDLVLIDCLTLWVANRLGHGDGDETILGAADELAAMLAERARSFVVVSNEVGAGVHPPTEVGVRFQDLLGAVNQRMASAADRVTMMVAGIPLCIKDASAASPAHVRAPEAP
jgi:adenosyl cobinamide kinase/adenosyl cobinamide phosphate guanylyltransferase